MIREFFQEKDIALTIEYAGTIEIMDKLNANENYDAVWASNSIWLYMLNNTVNIKNSKSTSINPVVFGITKSKARELGFIGKEVTTKDIVEVIKNGNLKFNMSSVTQTNTGATAYLGFLTTLAGNPEVLRQEDIEKESVKTSLISLFTGMMRSSGTEEFLEEMFLNGNYEAVITYETSIININQKLQAMGKEPLYIIYTTDGVSISDAPLAYIDHKNDAKQELFREFQEYVLGKDGQDKLAKTGRRVWYGGVSEEADKKVFNPNWGIDTTKYLNTTKYPSTEVIKVALGMYQTELRKPIHAIFCLDYSGSMEGEGIAELRNAMSYILDETKASNDLLQFAKKDKITIIPFSGANIDLWKTENGVQTTQLIDKINNQRVGGSTNIYDCSIEALEILAKEDREKYNVSVILMTDGQSNNGTFQSLYYKYKQLRTRHPDFQYYVWRSRSYTIRGYCNFNQCKSI